jgi:hypothetical protein
MLAPVNLAGVLHLAANCIAFDTLNVCSTRVVPLSQIYGLEWSEPEIQFRAVVGTGDEKGFGHRFDPLFCL